MYCRIDNDIYSTVDACPNAMEMRKAIERLKHGELINVQDLETSLFWKFGKFTSRDGETLDPNRGKENANSLPPTYDPEPEVVNDDEASSKEKEIDKLMALISMSLKKIYKPTKNNLRTSLNSMNINVDNTLRTNKGTSKRMQESKKAKGFSLSQGKDVA
ncbi:hypothetical protein Tco_0057115, partial [Tanacetum coccineum]